LQLAHVTAVLVVGAALHDYAWAERASAELWTQFLASLFRESVSVFTARAFAAHARVQLNALVLGKNHKKQARAAVRGDLRALQKLSERMPEVMQLRFEARIAHLEGHEQDAVRLLREHIAACERVSFRDEVERGRWALGKLTADAALVDTALSRLRSFGYVRPELDVAGHFPELS
jgi:hypothetical protein